MERKNKIILVFGLILLIFIGVILFYPIPLLIENRPVLTFLCKANPFTYVAKNTSYSCDNELDWTFKYLKKWKSYHGCNESTKGYNGRGIIGGLSSCQTIALT